MVMTPQEPTYSVVVSWRDVRVTSALNLSIAQTIAALVEVNRLFDVYGVSAGSDIKVLVLEESQTRH